MKKIFFLLMILFSFSISVSFAATNVTYFYGEPIKVDDENIEMLSNEILIDIINSKIDSVYYLKNNSENDISTVLSIPLENKDYSITVNNVEIKINGTSVDFEKNKNGDYLVYTQIPKGEGKKIEILYNTDNDLNNAKIIKYNMANFEGRKVGKVSVKIKIDEKNIPLIEKIYPGHFEFDEKTNTISVEYYNFELSPITKDVIVQKETFNNLLYNKEYELDEEERNTIKKWSEGITDEEQLFSGGTYRFYNYLHTEVPRYISDYIEKSYENEFYRDMYGNPLIYYLYCYNSPKNNGYLANKTICIDFVETEDGIDLYEKVGRMVYDFINEYDTFDETISQGIDSNMSYAEKDKIWRENIKKYYYSGDYDYIGCTGLYEYYYKKADYTEREYLKIIHVGAGLSDFGARIINVGEGINGEKLGATEEDIVKYVNSINADIYERVMIYDNPVKLNEYGYLESIVGYYNKENEEIAKAYKNGEYLADEYGTLKLLTNEYVKNNSEIPTIAHFAYYRTYENGKYVINYLESYTSELYHLSFALETDSAKKLISENREKNEKIKLNVEKSISDLKILDNEVEIQEKNSGERIELINNEIQNDIDINNTDELRDVFIISGFIVLISICVVIIIIDTKRKK